MAEAKKSEQVVQTVEKQEQVERPKARSIEDSLSKLGGFNTDRKSVV